MSSLPSPAEILPASPIFNRPVFDTGTASAVRMSDVHPLQPRLAATMATSRTPYRTMRKTTMSGRPSVLCRLLIGCVLTASSVQAFARADQDLVVMRRVISIPRNGAVSAPRGGSWTTGAWTWVSDAATCSSAARQVRTVRCEVAGTPVGDERCTDARPVDVQHVERNDGCSYEWTAGQWSDAAACATDSHGERRVSCMATDGRVVDDAKCDAGQRPDAVREGAVLAGCSVDWSVSDWSAYSTTCGAAATRTRGATCQIIVPAAANVDTDDSACVKRKPDLVEGPLANYAGCTYAWKVNNWGGWSSTCSSAATRSRTVTCQRSDLETVSDTSCQDAKPDATETKPNYTYCVGTFANGGFESLLQSWQATSAQAVTDGAQHSGQSYARLATGGSVIQVFKNPRGPTATFTIWVRTNPDKCRTLNVSLRDTANNNAQTNGVATTISACGTWSSGTITATLGGASPDRLPDL